jgi:suppressor of G2 allele of SKP1
LEDKQKDEEDAKKAASSDKWSSMIQEVEKEEEESKDVHGLFQKIFKNCDDDAKRAMLKSYTESKGTVLSTNWSEIGKKETEIKPPDSMEYVPPQL